MRVLVVLVVGRVGDDEVDRPRSKHVRRGEEELADERGGGLALPEEDHDGEKVVVDSEHLTAHLRIVLGVRNDGAEDGDHAREHSRCTIVRVARVDRREAEDRDRDANGLEDEVRSEVRSDEGTVDLLRAALDCLVARRLHGPAVLLPRHDRRSDPEADHGGRRA